jgi:hypothetical protein
MSERTLESEAAAQLTSQGFLVQREVGLLPSAPGRRNTVQADLVIWSADDPTVAPFAVIEVKRPTATLDRKSVGAQLAAYQNFAGAETAYLFDGTWHQLDRSSGEFVDVPTPIPQPSDGELAPAALVEQAVRGQFWQIMDRARANGRPGIEGLTETFRAALDDDEQGRFLRLLLATGVGRRAVNVAVNDALSHWGNWGNSATDPLLNEILARLLAPSSGQIFDPFCGTGATLRAAYEEAATGGAADVVLTGREVNGWAVNLAQLLAEVTRVPLRLQSADSYLAEPVPSEYVISDLPLGMRLPWEFHLVDGTTTPDGTSAGIDVCLRSLVPGGRAVLAVAPAFLFQSGGAERMRRWIDSDMRLVAVIRLPAGSRPGTGVPAVVLVIENRPATETLFANLEDDWKEQLGLEGDFMRAYLERLEAIA